MDDDFLKAVEKYFSIVEEACNFLIAYIENTEQITILSKYDLYHYFHTSRKFEFSIGNLTYYRHGNGIMVVCNDIAVVNWNFGCRSWWCGIDPFLMAETLKQSAFEDAEYQDGNFIKQKCEHYITKQSVYFYKGQYYIDLIKLSSMKVDFPTEYNNLVIEYKGITKSFPKCRSIDKFIRKSNKIYAGILALKNNYFLMFYNNDREVARIPYNDIAYPDSAVKIMNGEIIKPHIVGNYSINR